MAVRIQSIKKCGFLRQMAQAAVNSADTLYDTLPNNTWVAYQNVPYSVAYQFAATLTPDAMYAQQILPVYQAAVETNTCQQIATGTGSIWVM